MSKNYEAFVEELKHRINEATGIPMENMTFAKEGDKFAPAGDRLLVKFAEHEDAWEICGIYTNELFRAYQNGTSLDTIASEAAKDLNNIKGSGLYERTKAVKDYERAKRRLFIRLLNADKYAEELKDAVYKKIGDIALVLYMGLGEHQGSIISTKIHKSVVTQWRKDENEVFEKALSNTYYMTPPRIYKWERMIFDPSYEGENFMEMNCPLEHSAIGNCLSTTVKTNGAVAIFLPHVVEKFADILESDLYLVFTSVHEVMIHATKSVNPEDLKVVLSDTLKEATPEEDYLTSKIYKYSREDHKFECVTN